MRYMYYMTYMYDITYMYVPVPGVVFDDRISLRDLTNNKSKINTQQEEAAACCMHGVTCDV